MTTYEASLIFKPILDLDANDGGVLRALEDYIQSQQGKVVRTEKVGRKRLAYEIKKFKDGYITNLLIELEPATVASLRRYCQLNEDILRLTLLRMDDVAVQTSATTNTTIASQNAPQVREGRFGGGGGHRRGGGDFHGGGQRHGGPQAGAHGHSAPQSHHADAAVEGVSA